MNKMMPLLAIEAAALFYTGSQASASCVDVNLTSSSSKTYLTSLNTVIDSTKSQLLTTLVSQDPLVISNKTLAAQSIIVLGYNLSITPVLSTAHITGVKNAVPRHVNASTSNKLDIGADVRGSLLSNGSLSLVITQTNHALAQVCLTDPLHPIACSPLIVAMDFTLNLVNPSFVARTTADLVSCPANAIGCSDVAISKVIAAALLGRAQATMTPCLAANQERVGRQHVAGL